MNDCICDLRTEHVFILLNIFIIPVTGSDILNRNRTHIPYSTPSHHTLDKLLTSFPLRNAFKRRATKNCFPLLTTCGTTTGGLQFTFSTIHSTSYAQLLPQIINDCSHRWLLAESSRAHHTYDNLWYIPFINTHPGWKYFRQWYCSSKFQRRVSRTAPRVSAPRHPWWNTSHKVLY